MLQDSFSTPDDFKEACGYTIDQSWYPRVTKIVSIKAKPGLYHFYSQEKENAKKISAQSAKEGTLVHEAIESLLLGRVPIVAPEIQPAVDSFHKFKSKHRIEVEPENVERRIINEDQRYAGTVDALAKIDGKFGVLDIKTSLSIYRDYNLQTAAYLEALVPCFPEIQTRWILRVDQAQFCSQCGAKRRVKGGREKIRNLGWFSCPPGDHTWSEPKGEIEFQEFPSWQNDFQAFLGAKRLWEWEHEYWLKRIGYL